MASGQRHDTKDPRRARSRALKILFQADVRGETPAEVLKRLVEDPQGRAILDDLDDLSETEAVRLQAETDAAADTTDAPAVAGPGLDGFTRQLVLGVSDHRDEVDALIGRFARKWSVSRMPVVDRNVLRLATYELLHEHTSPAVVINEALELAKALSTEASGRYVNGVLEAIRRSIQEQDRPGA
jgi:transcription antitermination protein NusB